MTLILRLALQFHGNKKVIQNEEKVIAFLLYLRLTSNKNLHLNII